MTATTTDIEDLAKSFRRKYDIAVRRAEALQSERVAVGKQLGDAVSLVRCVIQATKLELADRIDVGCDGWRCLLGQVGGDACDRVLSGKHVSVQATYYDVSDEAVGEPITLLVLRRDASGTWHYGRATSDGFATAREATAAALADDTIAEQVATKLAGLTS